ncbi:hypothetical protein F511_45458 [Dorcoceras hygrometricum]|uniref:Uncharacterized protein n=1 Tax=Dorcoceras hygrometricum TaxID=472368 RepID=A0A2Z6ZWE6_9LAMI|nr:hypothetical protein F511_45458 [Dorcoceras hygrometricum]
MRRAPRPLFGARARISRMMVRDTAAPYGRRPCAHVAHGVQDAAPTGRLLCTHVAHGGARHHRRTYTNWSRRWPPPCARGVLRSGCTRAAGGAPPLRWLRGGEAMAVFDF